MSETPNACRGLLPQRRAARLGDFETPEPPPKRPGQRLPSQGLRADLWLELSASGHFVDDFERSFRNVSYAEAQGRKEGRREGGKEGREGGRDGRTEGTSSRHEELLPSSYLNAF